MTIAPCGHAFRHSPHASHFCGSMQAKLSASTMAPDGHALAHLLHPMQATEHALRATPPLSRLAHCTTALFRGRNSIRPRGQACAQAPQAVQMDAFTSGKPVEGFICSPPNVQASTQSPQPRQPYAQLLSPSHKEERMAQRRVPS